MIIALLTDFGARDHYVGIMKGVILGICPEARIIDLCHGIAPQNITSGAYLLETAHEAMPRGAVIVAVVDPGVGSARRAIAARIDDRVYVAPDNGCSSRSWSAPEEPRRSSRSPSAPTTGARTR